MPVYIDSITFADEYTGSGGGGITYLMGSVGDKITATIAVTFKWSARNIPVKVVGADKTIQRTDGGNFLSDGFGPNNSIALIGFASNSGTKTIATVTEDTITTTDSLTDEESVGVSIYSNASGSSLLPAMDFYFALIENSSPIDFHSLTDRETVQKFNVTGISSGMSPKSFTTPTNSKGWVDGSASIDDGTFTAYEQKYVITHTFVISPLFLASQLANLKNGLPPAPDYFKNSLALKYVCQIDAKFTNTDPTIPHSSQQTATFNLGNTAWFNEFLNGYDPEYSIVNIDYSNNGTGDPMDSIDIGILTDVTIVVKSASSKFTDANSPFVLNIIYLPLLESDYVNTKTTLKENFTWDRVKLNTGGATNGDNYGTNYQILENVAIANIDNQTAQIGFTAHLSTYLKNLFAGKDSTNRNYLIWVTPQANDVYYIADTDRNAVICDVNSFAYDTTDSSLWQIINDWYFYEFPDMAANPMTDYKGWPTDTIYSRGQFQVKIGAKTLSVRVAIEAIPTDTTKDSFVLEERSFTTEQYLASDNVEEVDIEEKREFRIPFQYPWNDMNLIRVPALDTDGYKAYELQYGFKLRHETWVQLVNYYRDFLKNHPQLWSIYSNTSGWNVRYNVYASVTDANGNTTDFEHTCNLTIKDLKDRTNGIAVTLQNFVDDEIEGLIDLDSNILSDEYTIVRATFTGDFSSFPSGYNGYYGILYLDIPGSGGINKIDQITSDPIDRVSDSAWLGLISSSEIDYTITPEFPINIALTNAGTGSSSSVSQTLSQALTAGSQYRVKLTVSGFSGAASVQMKYGNSLDETVIVSVNGILYFSFICLAGDENAQVTVIVTSLEDGTDITVNTVLAGEGGDLATLIKKDNNTITLEARLNYKLLNPSIRYVTGARLGFKSNLIPCLSLDEDGLPTLDEDGSATMMENCP